MAQKICIANYLCQGPNWEMNWQFHKCEITYFTLWMAFCDLQIRALSAMTEGAITLSHTQVKRQSKLATQVLRAKFVSISAM